MLCSLEVIELIHGEIAFKTQQNSQRSNKLTITRLGKILLNVHFQIHLGKGLRDKFNMSLSRYIHLTINQIVDSENLDLLKSLLQKVQVF